jgi:tetratricopeptide (TPR) repeat protein
MQIQIENRKLKITNVFWEKYHCVIKQTNPMKYFLFFAVLFTVKLSAQPLLSFDKRFIECENKWVALYPNKEDTSFAYGFVYVDPQAGLTFDLAGKVKINSGKLYSIYKVENTSMKYRLQADNQFVAIIPPSMYEDLHISATPEWLKNYLVSDTNSVQYLYSRGFMYNAWNECKKALAYLQKAQTINPNYKGLSVELAYSYNCLEEYDSAIFVLQNALKTNPQDAYINKELIYAQTKSGQLDKAAESCKNAIATFTDETYNGEICYNLLHAYFRKNDKGNFNLWLSETKKWNAGNENILKNITLMENEINK